VILAGTMSSQSQLRVAVIGGGILGASSAYHLARSGARVWLVTEGPPASGASGRSLSWLNSFAVRSEHYHQLRILGIDRYRSLFARQPHSGWLRFDGGLSWQPADKAEILRDIHAHQLAHGYDSQLISPDEVERQVPGVNSAAIPGSGAVWNPGEGWVDLPSLIDYLIKELVRFGGKLIANAGEAAVISRAGRVFAVQTQGHDAIHVDAALLATGATVPGMAARFGVPIPDATVIALLIRTKPVQTQLRAVLNTPRASIRPTPDGGLAVDSDWTDSHIELQANGTYRIPAAIVEELLVEASGALAGTPSLIPETQGIGPKPIPGDGEPVLGQLGDIDGLYVAFTHSGATLGLIVGELLAREMISGPQALLGPYSASRFS